jgi:hypothetical protein
MATPDDARRPDGGPLDLLTERAVDAALAATLPLLRANLYRTLAERLPRPSRPTKRPRVALPPGDEPVDELTRAKARATLDRHRRRT